MGWWDDLTGGTAADAAAKAGGVSRAAGASTGSAYRTAGDASGAAYRSGASDTYGKQQSAIERLLGYGNDYAASTRDLSHAYDPYVETGNASSLALRNLIADPSSVRNLPVYAFDQEEGIKALDRSAAARGRLESGRTSKDLLRFAHAALARAKAEGRGQVCLYQHHGYLIGPAKAGARS